MKKLNIFIVTMSITMILSCTTTNRPIYSQYDETVNRYIESEKLNINDLIVHQCGFYLFTKVPNGQTGICLINKIKNEFSFQPYEPKRLGLLLDTEYKKSERLNSITNLPLKEIENYTSMDYEHKIQLSTFVIHQVQIKSKNNIRYVINFSKDDYDDFLMYLIDQKTIRVDNLDFVYTNEYLDTNINTQNFIIKKR